MGLGFLFSLFLLPLASTGISVSLAMAEQLVGVGLATPPRKKHPQPPTKLEAEDPLALLLILGVPVGLQMWRLHVGPLLG